MKKWNYEFDVSDTKKVRMIVHTDCKNEADDQFALAHHLMTPKFIIKGIIGGHFNINPQEWGEGNTANSNPPSGYCAPPIHMIVIRDVISGFINIALAISVSPP
mgnify:CR=1 FL=1